MSLVLDTNICSAHVRRPAGLAHRFIQHSGNIYISTIVLGELFFWAYSRSDPRPLLDFLNKDLLADVGLLPFDATCAERFGMERGRLLRQGISIPDSDLMIAAVSLVHDFTLVTHNTKDVKNIPGLRLDDWLMP